MRIRVGSIRDGIGTINVKAGRANDGLDTVPRNHRSYQQVREDSIGNERLILGRSSAIDDDLS